MGLGERGELLNLTSNILGIYYGVWEVVVTPNGGAAIAVSDDRTLKVWDLESGKVIASFTADGSLMTCAVSSDGVTIVAGERSGQVHILHVEGL